MNIKMVEKNKVNVITMNMKNKKGGSYLRMNELVYGMSKKGWKVHHISPKGFRCENSENIIHHKIFYIPIPGGYILSEIQIFFRMLYIVMKNRIDIIVAFGISSSFICSLVKIFSRHTKLCVSLRGDDIVGLKVAIRNKYLKFLLVKESKILERVILRKADFIIFLSNDLRERVLKRTKYNHIEKTKVIHNSITPRLKRLAKDEGINFDAGKKIIGFVGLLYEEGKGLKYLIKAFYKVKQEVPNSMLVIVGEGPDKRKLISLAKSLGLEEDVIFTGFRDNPVQYMKGFDLMVLPSIVPEGFGIVILEAIYVGTPVIGSKVGGIPEVLKYDELLFEPKNVDELSSKIINLLKKDEAYRRAVDLCRERKKVFTFDWSGEMIKAIEKTLTFIA